MNFTKQLATERDFQEIRQRFGIRLAVGKAFVINSERDCVLRFIFRDRFDMGGTTNEYWNFGYQGKSYTVACKPDINAPDYGPYHLNLMLSSIEEDNPRRQVSRVDQDFIDTFAQAFYIYNKYGDINPQDKTARGKYIYHFSFKNEQEIAAI